MNGFFVSVLWGLGGLLFAAIVVAWWEHLGRQGAIHAAREAGRQVRAVTVDVELDALAAHAQGSGDVYERQQTLGGAMARMAGAEGTGWTDTAPMIGAGLRKSGKDRRDQGSMRDQFEPTAS